MTKVHVTFPIADPALDLLQREGWEIDVYRGTLPQPPDKLLRATKDCHGLLCTLFDKLNRDFFQSLAPSRLRVVAQFGVGYDNIDVKAAAEFGVRVTNTPNVLTDATAEMALALMLAAARRLGEGERLLRAGKWTGWEPGQMLGHGVTGKKLGIIGAGRIGTAFALKARGFAMQVLYTGRRVNATLESEFRAERVSLDELLAHADFVSIHVPLNDQTRHLIGAEELKKMKPTAVLINTSRGAVVDEKALVQALQKGRIAAAGLDVYENEPRLTPGLAKLPNVVLAPHLGSATRETRLKMAMLAARNLVCVLQGQEPPNPVNRL